MINCKRIGLAMSNTADNKDWLDNTFGVYIAGRIRIALTETAKQGHGEVTICFRGGHPYKITTDQVELLQKPDS